jgi:hypothetical protein
MVRKKVTFETPMIGRAVENSILPDLVVALLFLVALSLSGLHFVTSYLLQTFCDGGKRFHFHVSLESEKVL